jgi:hypothetical protein
MSRPKIYISPRSPILPGSISTVMAPCGRKNCCCHADKRNWHGPYHRWTGSIDGKRTSVALSQNILQECLSRIDNYKDLLDQWDNVLNQALINAPWRK